MRRKRFWLGLGTETTTNTTERPQRPLAAMPGAFLCLAMHDPRTTLDDACEGILSRYGVGLT